MDPLSIGRTRVVTGGRTAVLNSLVHVISTVFGEGVLYPSGPLHEEQLHRVETWQSECQLQLNLEWLCVVLAVQDQATPTTAARTVCINTCSMLHVYAYVRRSIAGMEELEHHSIKVIRSNRPPFHQDVDCGCTYNIRLSVVLLVGTTTTTN